MKKRVKEKEQVKVKRRKRKDIDKREECITRCTRLLFRLDKMNRRYFRGDSDDVTQASAALARVVEYVKTLPASWNPRSKGKNALIPGMKIRIRDGIPKSRMGSINALGGAKRFYGAIIFKEDTSKTFIVKLMDDVGGRPVKTLVWKCDIEPVSEGGPEPVIVDDDPKDAVEPEPVEQDDDLKEQARALKSLQIIGDGAAVERRARENGGVA